MCHESCCAFTKVNVATVGQLQGPLVAHSTLGRTRHVLPLRKVNAPVAKKSAGQVGRRNVGCRICQDYQLRRGPVSMWKRPPP
jgi:hypothetical protein